jgi:hypothetical protein
VGAGHEVTPDEPPAPIRTTVQVVTARTASTDTTTTHGVRRRRR